MSKKNHKLWPKGVSFLILLVASLLAWINQDAILRILYPAPYYQEIADLCAEFDEDLPLVLAIIQTESRFRREALSHRGAVGLMQIMPDTAKWLAKELGLEEYSQESLAEPKWNLLLGVAYIHYLRQQFPDNIPQVLAAYNAGPTKTKSWLKDGYWDGSLESIDSIPYGETRSYIIKVLDRYKKYQVLYPW